MTFNGRSSDIEARGNTEPKKKRKTTEKHEQKKSRKRKQKLRDTNIPRKALKYLSPSAQPDIPHRVQFTHYCLLQIHFGFK